MNFEVEKRESFFPFAEALMFDRGLFSKKNTLNSE